MRRTRGEEVVWLARRKARSAIVGLDVGTTKVCAVVGETDSSGHVTVVGLGVSPSAGLRRGVVVDIESTVRAVGEAVRKAERMAGVAIRSGYVGVGGTHISSVNNRGVVAVAGPDREIRPEDVERAVEAASVVNLSADREIIHILPRQFVVDGYEGIRDPVGMLGSRLEVETHIVTGASTSLQNVLRSVRKAGLEVEEVVAQSFASAEAVLLPAEKELGVAVGDIGGGTVNFSIFDQGSLWYTSVLPVGGDHITSDIAVGLRTPISEAERIKLERGSAVASLAGEKEMVEVASVSGRETRQVSERMLAEIIEARMQEVFALIRQELRKSGYTGLIPGGLVVAGGTALLRNIVQLGMRELDLPVRIGFPAHVDGLVDSVANPMYAAGVGLVQYGARRRTASFTSDRGSRGLSRVVDRVKDWLDDFF